MFGLPRWTPEESSWYALFTATGDEDNVKQRILYRFGDQYSVVVPKKQIKERKNGEWNIKVKTLIPGYVLLKGSIDKDKYYKFKDIPNLYNILKNDETLLNIQKCEMDIIERLMYNRGDIIGFSKIILNNDKVRVIEGPLKSLEGLIVSIDKRKGRARVKLNFLGEARTIDLGISVLEAL